MLAEQLKEIATQRLRHMPVAAEDLLRIAAEVHRVEVIARKVLEREAAGLAPFSAYPCGCSFEDEHDPAKQTRWCGIHSEMRDRLAALEVQIESATKYLRRGWEHPYSLQDAAEKTTDALEKAEARLAELEARERERQRGATRTVEWTGRGGTERTLDEKIEMAQGQPGIADLERLAEKNDYDEYTALLLRYGDDPCELRAKLAAAEQTLARLEAREQARLSERVPGLLAKKIEQWQLEQTRTDG